MSWNNGLSTLDGDIYSFSCLQNYFFQLRNRVKVSETKFHSMLTMPRVFFVPFRFEYILSQQPTDSNFQLVHRKFLPWKMFDLFEVDYLLHTNAVSWTRWEWNIVIGMPCSNRLAKNSDQDRISLDSDRFSRNDALNRVILRDYFRVGEDKALNDERNITITPQLTHLKILP